MRICFISHLYPPYVMGGTEINVQREAEALAQRGNEISVITTSPSWKQSSVETIRSVKVYRISPLNLYPVFEFREKPYIVKPFWHLIDLWNPHSYTLMQSILLKEKPHIVNIHVYQGLSLSVFTLVKKLNIPTIYTATDYSLLCARANLVRSSGEICTHPPLICDMYKRIRKHLVNGKINILTAQTQFVLDKLTANGLFTDTRAIKLLPGIKLSDKREKKSYDIIDILYVGRVVKAKGVHVLIDSFKKLNQRNVRLHIVGEGSDMEHMRKLTNGDARINFHGFIPHAELAKFYQAANLVVVPSLWYEVFGLINIEAFSYGTPAIVSNIGGLPEVIDEGYNGHMFQPGNSEELSAILENLVNNPDRLRRLEEGAFISSKKYAIEEHTNNLEALYMGLLNC